MSISSTGKNLNILIRCKYNSLHNWLALASWYSIRKNLPEALVEIQYARNAPTRVLFGWTGKLKIPCRSFAESFVPTGKQSIEVYKLCENNLWITPDVFAVNEFMENNLGPVDIKTSDKSTFVKINDGVGNFKLSSWIDSGRAPFADAISRLWTEDISINEMKVLKLWEGVGFYYSKL